MKVRVINKSDIRTWSNARGDGKLFSVDLKDDTGEIIRATCFNAEVDKFYPIIEVRMGIILSTVKLVSQQCLRFKMFVISHFLFLSLTKCMK